MLDWLYSPQKAAGNDVPIDPALTEAGTTLAPFDPFLGRTRRKASAGVTDAIKAELYDSDELEYADYGREASQQPHSGPRPISQPRRRATKGFMEALRGEADDSDEHENLDEAQNQPAADGASVGQDSPLAQNNASTSASRALRSPTERKKTVKSVQGAAQAPRKRGKTSQAAPSSDRWTAAEHEALLRATDLVSIPGTALVWLGFEELRRPQLLAEYIRRQTGTIKTSSQINRRLTRITRLPAMRDRVRGSEMSLKEARETDWHARLGPDRFPHTKPVSLLDTYGTTTAKKGAAPASPIADLDSNRAKKPRLSPPDGTSTPAADFATASNAYTSGSGLALDQEGALKRVTLSRLISAQLRLLRMTASKDLSTTSPSHACAARSPSRAPSSSTFRRFSHLSFPAATLRPRRTPSSPAASPRPLTSPTCSSSIRTSRTSSSTSLAGEWS
ncbi:RHTO0S15e01200g1_1 [Rhodotorula toruloides]|uniref:RHTO0S15e01200g1_1 n=1 Tax=Rhodotorula toruloides TaxID=5286 RepID=A0A061BCN9_RHOTO|nr:RHTO0S15e01200g1_1 [Rhodotorula toruloides]